MDLQVFTDIIINKKNDQHKFLGSTPFEIRGHTPAPLTSVCFALSILNILDCHRNFACGS